MMSGSQNRLKRNGSTAEEESGPPNWNRTTLIFFFSVIGQSRKRIQDGRLMIGTRSPLESGVRYGAAAYLPPSFRRRMSSCRLAMRRATEIKQEQKMAQITMYA